MPFTQQDTHLYRRDERADHKLLSKEDRERLLKPYLPPPRPKTTTPSNAGPSSSSSNSSNSSGRSSRDGKRSRLGVRRFLRHQLHVFAYLTIHALFSVFIRMRQAYQAVKDRLYSVLYYHHRTPELIERDVRTLKRLPQHLSVILTLEDDGRGGAELERLVNDVADLSAWCACAGIPTLSVYEKTGLLKGYLVQTHSAVSQKLASYFGPNVPGLTLAASHQQSAESAAPSTLTEDGSGASPKHLRVVLLSAEDGRDSIVDLTKTLAEMAQRNKISPNQISIDLLDAELSENVMSDPELLILFGPHVELAGYPPWHIRLTEIFHVQDNQGVGYQVFLRGLYNYAKAQMRFGR